MRKTKKDLMERVKELRCLYSVSELIESSHMTVEGIIQGAIDLIPAGWQYPELTRARISAGDIQRSSEGFEDIKVVQWGHIRVKGKNIGRIEVGYTELPANDQKDPFLPEERALLKAIAESLGRALERSESDNQLRLHTEALERANEELRRFAIISSHHLQEPLRKIINFSELLERSNDLDLDERGRRRMHYVVDAARRMRDLVNDLMIYMSLGGSDLDIESIDPTGPLARAIEGLGQEISWTAASVTNDPLPAVRVDEDGLNRVFYHLISNGIKFRGSHAPEIHISAKKAGPEWVFTISDNGLGFEQEYGQKIFELFERLHRPDEYDGTGIGLAICKRIIERHGGRIWAESEPGAGSKFHFSLPD
jgi:light-regulated signal transduction histidine kinase (bacteriophytochrome)